MDFYAQQDKARRQTTRLLVLFCFSLVLIIGVVNVVFYPSIYVLRAYVPSNTSSYLENKRRQLEVKSHISPEEQRKYLDYERRLQESYSAPEKRRQFVREEISTSDVVFLHIGFSLLVLAAILLMSFRRISKLSSSGGDWLAGQLGGVFVDPVEPGSGSLRQLVNVVEEMTIAASIPMPNIYVLGQEPGINALAAGWDYENAVIVVSRGALTELSRDELQGVIAHEMSHILSGDMRLNIRLVGLLYGILAVSVAGKKMFIGNTLSGRKGGLQGYLFGVILMTIGSLGVFCGRLIRAGVSRQREFLADAQAVQLTRNPYGIAGALKKIGGFTKGSEMNMARREEVSHMFFASGHGQVFWAGLLATHPPLASLKPRPRQQSKQIRLKIRFTAHFCRIRRVVKPRYWRRSCKPAAK
jgi:Zn-dependent protease with chaperone function